MRVMIVVTHLLGTGHLARALTLGRAFADAGDSVTVVSGGTAVPHFDTSAVTFVQLPALHSDGTDFTTLLDDAGRASTPALMAQRLQCLVGTLQSQKPDVVITELFPFGRRSLRDEFSGLLEAAHGSGLRPLVLSSIRDILAPPSKPDKATFAEDLIDRFYDGVLVHADPDLIRLDRSWPVSDALAQRLHYTGFVAPAPPPGGPKHGAIVVSAGGGSVGDRLFQTACDAARMAPHLTWHCVIGGGQDRVQSIATGAPENMVIEATRPDFRTLLSGAAASVSLCGYNTAMDVLQTGIPAVLIPFDDGGEVEQGLRAEAMRKVPGIAVMAQEALSATGLIAAVEQVRNAPSRPPRRAGMDGAAHTVDIVRDMRARQIT